MPHTPDEPHRPFRVLFLCTANSARSQIAEALLRQKGRDGFVVASAGMSPGVRVDPAAITALAELGIDWHDARPKGVDAVTGKAWDFIITTCDQIKESCPTFPGQPVYAHWSVPDPAAVQGASRDAAFRDTLRLLSWRIDLMLALRPELLERAAAEVSLKQIGLAHPDPDASIRSP